MKPYSVIYRKLIRYSLILLGCTCVCLGVLGIFLPLLPTTVFLLIAAWCFANSSDHFHQWITNHPHLGPIIQNWRNKSGITRQVRNKAIIMLWVSMTISILIVAKLWISLLLIIIGCFVSIYLFKQPLLDNSVTLENSSNTLKSTSTPPQTMTD